MWVGRHRETEHLSRDFYWHRKYEFLWGEGFPHWGRASWAWCGRGAAASSVTEIRDSLGSCHALPAYSVQHDRVMRCFACWDRNDVHYFILVLSEVINLTKEWSIMQASCNNYCARLAAVEFVSIGRNSGIGGNWVQSLFERGGERVIFAFAFSRIIPMIWIHR